jgi:sigma-B regulation protein RsbU (phosphoserine phosphatase)
LEADLELAAQIQNGLLPQPTLTIDGWDVAFHYEPANLVSGDYVDLITSDDQNVHFVLGDVSGKGVAASILMANLQAMFRTLVSINLPLDRMLERASSVFCESTLPSHYATLVTGKLGANGNVEISNAGHLPPLLLHEGELKSIDGSGLPLGMFCAEKFSVTKFQMETRDTLFLYTDGLSEARDHGGIEYGIERLARCLASNHRLTPMELVGRCVREVSEFRTPHHPSDDLTLMAIQRVH